MTTNASPEYGHAEKEYLQTKTLDEKLLALEKMISYAPAHKGGENLRAALRLRYKKLVEKIEKTSKSSKSTKVGIKKSEMQALILGFPNTGKTSVFNLLTGLKLQVTEHPYSTTIPKIGMMNYEDLKIQLVDMPPFPNTDRGIINTTDTILLIINNFDQIKQSEQFLQKTRAKIIILFNKTDLFNENEKRKITETLKSKKHSFILFSSINHENLAELKEKIFKTFTIIRIYTKEPKKEVSKEPMIMKENSTIKDVAEKILKGFSKKIKRARIWGPSSKFGGQEVGLSHVLKDKDIIEFQTK
ncbi:MAG: GTPase [Nanoarchaeota archaeon]|nr:GTPase [Nanoarchaeota archaeon]